MEKLNKDIFFMLKKNQHGPYVIATSKDGQEIFNIEEWLIEDEWLTLRESDKDILNFINKSNKKELFNDWDNLWGNNSGFSLDETKNDAMHTESYLVDDSHLVSLLLNSDNFVDEFFEPIKYVKDNNTISLNIIETESASMLKSTLLLNGQYSDFLLIDDEYALIDSTIYELNIENTSLYSLENLKTEFPTKELEQFLSIFFTFFKNIEITCLNLNLEFCTKKSLLPEIIIEKISMDNSLFIKVLISSSSMNYQFLKDNNITKTATINPLESKIIVSEIDTSLLFDAVQEISKSISKYQKNLKIKNGYYIDNDNLIILQEKLAKEFIGKELLKLASKYKVSGTEKLKKYNIKAVKPKIIGTFKHNIDFLEGDVEIEIEGDKFSILDILSTYKTESYIVLSNGTNALINHKYIEKLERIFKDEDKKKLKISFFDLPIIEDLIDEKIYKEEFSQTYDFFNGMNNLKDYSPVFPNVNATLREYQEYGFKWLSYLVDNNLGGCLADDMGLGKTLQAITLLSKIHLIANKPSLVIMPKSLIFNWESEINRFNPRLKVGIYYGNNRDLSVFNNSDVVLTTYGTIRNDIEKFQDLNLESIILDESQNIKNINAQTTKAIMTLNSKYRIALSGTPIENNLTELYSLFRFLNPSMFGSLEEFNNIYANPIQRDNDKTVIEELRKKIYPFILRRVKKEVLKDLPEKIEQTLYVEMNKDHKNYYNERRSYYFNMINTQIKEQGLGKSQFYILKALNELRQLTSCPESKNEDIISSKRIVLINNVIDAVANGHKVLIFTNYIKSIENICEDLEKQGIKYLSMTGSTKDRQSLVDKFQNDPKYKVFVMTLKTGGVGLNLTSADTIFIYDPWWNKTVENQAIDRAYRIGQNKTVLSYKLILKDSIEEKILKLQEIKNELLENLISEDNSSVKFLTEKDIQFILSE
ncbi:MAG: DEAD/DEAH box helicase [Fusobacteriaceae bacterium]|nr:DEAD/DEAH box helicase [Fusobacteriaceae bacterium]MBP9510093.1 DEAD/DEAH box helicase [Fusobacteriaceae bacterium]